MVGMEEEGETTGILIVAHLLAVVAAEAIVVQSNQAVAPVEAVVEIGGVEMVAVEGMVLPELEVVF